MFEDAASEAHQATDMVRARRLVQDGRKASERRHGRAAGVARIWDCSPVGPEAQARARVGREVM